MKKTKSHREPISNKKFLIIILAISAVLIFMNLFNKRFDSIKNKKDEKSSEKVNKSSIEGEFDLPKAKNK